ncbi:MAG: tRNA pseudouridine(55) synthase TruB, partial [Planctomycetota bacterium]|nr:tRNA pseudouridine(55) synthase TruB [Planctomycetota bacterium]
MSPKLTNPYNGLLNINKPAGMTSHDVVNRVRRILGQKRVGHAGTLDPAATGILLVCAGQATRLVEYLVPGIKTYQGTIRLGQATDTYDSEGEFTSETETDHLDRGMVEAAMVSFTGDIEQVPPAYSAIKRDGVPSYKLARKGKDVNLPARRIRIESFELLGWNQPELTFRIVCQSGTYVRSIAHDLGAAL